MKKKTMLSIFHLSNHERYIWMILILIFLNWILLQKRMLNCDCCERHGKRKTAVIRLLQYNERFCVLPKLITHPCNHSIGLTMGLHSTLDNFDHNMVAQLKSWKGCVSLSLFVDAPEESTAPQPMTPFQLMAELSLIRFFQQHSITNVTVHQVFEQWNDENGFRCADYRLERLKVLPEELKSILDLQEQPSMGEEDLYPINVMRNIARMFIPKFSLTTLADSHFRYSKNFSENILETIRSTRVSVNLRRALFVYPSFEGLPNDKNHIPNTRNELRDAILNGTAQSFMKDANPMAHFLRDLDQWLHNENDVGIGDSGYLHSEWDPQFVSLNSLPFHDERFPYMQADNLNQRWELCRSGYRFMILHGAFAIHPGIRPGDDSFRKKMRRKMWKVIDKAISDFIAFIESTYPQTYRKCPDFEIGKPWKQPLPSHDSNATESIHQNRPISRKQTLQTYLNAMVALRKAKIRELNSKRGLVLEKKRLKSEAEEEKIWGIDLTKIGEKSKIENSQKKLKRKVRKNERRIVAGKNGGPDILYGYEQDHFGGIEFIEEAIPDIGKP